MVVEAYACLKADLRKGRFAPEMILNVHLIASELGVSISPVRDAMERLVGERLVLLRPEGGFQMPPMTEDIARDLYLWHAILIGWALRKQAPVERDRPPVIELSAAEADGSVAVALATAEIFDEIGRWSGNTQLQLAISAAADKIAALRSRETMIVGRRAETEDILTLMQVGDLGRLRAAVGRYHRRRYRYCDRIVAALYRTR